MIHHAGSEDLHETQRESQEFRSVRRVESHEFHSCKEQTRRHKLDFALLAVEEETTRDHTDFVKVIIVEYFDVFFSFIQTKGVGL